MTRPCVLPNMRSPRTSAGFSIVELMTAITIGLLILAGLSSVFVNSSNANREMKNSAEQIENGRFATEFLTQDLRHAGFYGELTALPAVPGVAPDPCTVPSAGAVSDTSNTQVALAIQYIAPASIPTNCAAFLTPANLQSASDIVVVRRGDSTAVNAAGAGSMTGGTIYLQTTGEID